MLTELRKSWLLRQHILLGVKVYNILDLVNSIKGASITLPSFESRSFYKPIEDIGVMVGKFYGESWKMGWIGQVLAHSDISGVTYFASNLGLSVSSFFREPYRGAKEQVFAIPIPPF